MRLSVAGVVLCALIGMAAEDYASMRRKLDQIEADRAPRGARVSFTLRELNAFAAHEVPDGVRNPKLVLGQGTATGTALVDFLKVRKAQGYQPGWLISKLLDGERPVTVTVAVRSGQGNATIEVKRADVGGISVDGSTLDFLIQNFVIPMYPDVALGRPFELGHGVERMDIAAGGVTLAISK
jgi:hypothetical protein